jgi:GNAT superfamily N-acetyltransferase
VLAVRPAASPADWHAARALIRAYEQEIEAACCFEGLERELAELDGRYAPPDARLLVALVGSEPVGCGAFRRLDGDIAEGRRLYVLPEWRGHGIGGALVLALLEEARRAGFRALRIETLPGRMSAAAAMYRQLGFREIPPYVRRPIEGAIYLELALPA